MSGIKNLISLLLLAMACNYSIAQADTTHAKKGSQSFEIEKSLKEVIVSATKTERQLINTTVPVLLIKDVDVKNTNALRLQTVLEEQTGLNTVSSALGTSIQIQGLDADYSLIMIDGVPIVGRLNGTLNLSRLTVSNISHIEVVKGPSSVLFGSNALAGVVNIITRNSEKENTMVIGATASSYDTFDYSLNSSFHHNKYSGNAGFNYYSTGGYDLASNYQGVNQAGYLGKTVSPHSNYTFTSNNKYQFSKTLEFNFDLRYFKEDESYNFLDNNSAEVAGTGMVEDWAVKPWLRKTWSDKVKSKLSFSANEYGTKTEEIVNENEVYGGTVFDESYSVVELQNDITLNHRNEITFGLGYESESVQTSRLITDDKITANNKYLYLQYIYSIDNKFDLIMGTRMEDHKNYASQINPKLSLKYNFAPKYSLKASVGRGFKKPDFKQLYFNYTNNAIGYTVLGTTYVEEGINNLVNQNQIIIHPLTNEPIVYDLYNQILSGDGLIEAESSVGINLGLNIRSIKNTLLDINLFRNDLKNLIEISPIALKTNGMQAYSYQNLNSIYTQGLEVNVKHYLKKGVKIFAGYQYLEAKDKNVLEQLNEGDLFAADPETGRSFRISEDQYGGLFNRANHSANFKVFLEDVWREIDFNTRVLYKGKFGYADRNNNQILDAENEYIDGYFLVNAGIQKSFLKEKLQLRFGVDNILDYTYSTPEYTISSLPGRIYQTSITYKLTKK